MLVAGPTDATNSPWFYRPAPRGSRRLRLFCFPYAGGAAHIYRTWPEGLPLDVELVAVQLPGRGTRFNEAPHSDFDTLLAAVEDAIEPALNGPFAFFGHSMGAFLAFELSHRLKENALPVPLHLIVSGCRAPHLPNRYPPIHDLPGQEFRDRLGELNGTPAEILGNEDLMSVLEPTLRADLRVAELYAYRPRPLLSMPISAFCGLDDVETPPADMESWGEHSSASFAFNTIAGDHFFLHSAEDVLLGALSESLSVLR